MDCMTFLVSFASLAPLPTAVDIVLPGYEDQTYCISISYPSLWPAGKIELDQWEIFQGDTYVFSWQLSFCQTI